MTSFFYLGNNETIETSMSNIDIDGDNIISNISITNTKLDLINTSINNLESNTSNIDISTDEINNKLEESIKIKNKRGECYAVSRSLDLTGGTSFFIYLNNPSGSTKRRYIYNIGLASADGAVPGRVEFKFRLYTVAMTTSTSTAIDYCKLKTSSINVYSDKTITGFNGNNENSKVDFQLIQTRADGNTVILDFQEEYIILEPNSCFVIAAVPDTDNAKAFCNIRWFEEDI